MRCPAKGQTLVEYGILLALVVVASMGALMLLRPAIGNNITNSGNSASNYVNNFFGSARNGADAVAKGVFDKLESAQSANAAGKYQGVYDPSTDTIVFPVSSSTPSGKNATSVDGNQPTITHFMAQQLAALTQNWTSSDGKSLSEICPPCAKYLKATADSTNQLADTESTVNGVLVARASNPSIPNPDYWPVKGAADGFSSNANAFFDALNKAIQANPNDPSLLALQQQVNGYTGIASTLALKNYLMVPSTYAWTYNGGEVPPLQSYVVGTPPAGMNVTRAETPVVTRKAGRSIRAL